ncbi:Molybdopterin-guanine dinucleotide biosynthesis adapter protein [Patescibacteria group bacterium]|nr:Molybdopterin-guanine dinucleotide biosynthesis adapter protein [Patescibacteria group bacterium]
MTLSNAKIPIIGFTAASGTGKTTLLTQLIPLLKQRGLRVGLIKHSHHDFEIDYSNKDSFRLRQAGASPVLLVSPYRRVIITETPEHQEPVLNKQLTFLNQSELDLILVEGFKHETFIKIELHRPALNHALLYPNDRHIIAVASDEPIDLPDYLTLLDLNQVAQIADFMLTLL